jgi:para-nitrobenzyl esterase
MIRSVAAVFAAAAAATAVGAASVSVRIDSGTLVGEVADGVKIFRGVPFAKPPVGALRWAPPEPIAWSGDRDALKFQPACPQPINADGRPNGGGVSGATSEDCLYLNVWAPVDAKNAPVMLWLYGGAGYLGGAHLAAYDGTSFAKNGVIVVTMNYRLGALGNFAHPALTRAAKPTDGLSNYALMDAIAGLQWVKRNITRFGGEPGNVTLFGQSAGGAMVSSLLSAPPAKGLFHKAIVHSGASLGAGISLAEGEAAGVKAAAALALPGADATVEQLRAIPAQTFVGTQAVRQGVRGVLDGRIKTIDTRDGFASGATVDVPLIVGSNNGEPGADRATTMVNLAAAGAPSYQYYFTYVPDWRKAAQPNGAPHSAELRYVFASLAGESVTAKDREVAAGMNSCWTAFAKATASSRSLTCATGFVWPARTSENDAVAVFGDTTTLERATVILERAKARTSSGSR